MNDDNEIEYQAYRRMERRVKIIEERFIYLFERPESIVDDELWADQFMYASPCGPFGWTVDETGPRIAPDLVAYQSVFLEDEHFETYIALIMTLMAAMEVRGNDPWVLLPVVEGLLRPTLYQDFCIRSTVEAWALNNRFIKSLPRDDDLPAL